MTRKLYLVNMGNWKNDEYDISINDQEIVNLIPGDKIEVEDASNGAERIVIEVHRLNNREAPSGYNPPSVPDGMEDYKEAPTVDSLEKTPDWVKIKLSDGTEHKWQRSDIKGK